MASSLPAALPVVTKASSSSASRRHFAHHPKLYFHLSPKPKLLLESNCLAITDYDAIGIFLSLNTFFNSPMWMEWIDGLDSLDPLSTIRFVLLILDVSVPPLGLLYELQYFGCLVLIKAPVDGSSNAVPTPDTKPEVQQLEGNDGSLANETSAVSLSDASISEFMSQVANIVKLVDSRDIVELQLKQSDCELIIRKKEALPQQPLQAPVVMMQPSPPQAVVPFHFPPPQTTAPVAPISSTPSLPTPTAPPAATPTKSSLPPLKCPMAGTFYRSPAPGEQPFVKVGDKVNKGQILCIIEAMKLMNEIEVSPLSTLPSEIEVASQTNE
ncbi:hypothetical protein ACLOJK_023087 [Asimina triloba]